MMVKNVEAIAYKKAVQKIICFTTRNKFRLIGSLFFGQPLYSQIKI